jgi:hypothetical protein
MKNVKRLLFTAAVLTPSILLAQSPFDGTWKTIPAQTKFSPKPIVFAVSQGFYDAFTTVPPIHVKADGQDQPVSGHPYDTIAVTEVDEHTIQLVYKKNGKTASEVSETVSADGKTLTYESKFYPPASDQIVTTAGTMERIGNAPDGANATSGSWRIQAVSTSENNLFSIFKRSGDELACSAPTGETWTANLDGKDYPVTGAYSYDSISLKEIDDRQIEASFKREGELIEVDKMTISPDGKTRTTIIVSPLTGRVSTYVSEKQ